MPDCVLILIGSLVPIAALTLALASGHARVDASARAGAADSIFDAGIDGAGEDTLS